VTSGMCHPPGCARRKVAGSCVGRVLAHLPVAAPHGSDTPSKSVPDGGEIVGKGEKHAFLLAFSSTMGR
jgi:hypothetical protein